MEFFDSIRQVKVNWQPYKQWEAKQGDKEFQRKELQKKVPTSKEDLQKASQYGRTLIDSINVMDQYSINKAEDVELVTDGGLQLLGLGVGIIGWIGSELILKTRKAAAFLGKMPELKAEFAKRMLPAAGVALPSLLVLPYFMVKSKAYQKEASRVARYQAREEELKDAKHFVVYNEDQIKEAEEIAKTLPEIPDKKKGGINPLTNWNESIKSIKTILSSHKDYENWKQEHVLAQKQKLEALESVSVSPEQIQDAKKDQDNLLRIIRKIETYSQNYLNNTEMATNIVTGSSLVTGYLGGKIVSLGLSALQKIKVLSLKPQNLEIINGSSVLVGPLAMLAIAGTYMVKIQKEAARIGRYKAKQELLKDPNNFITYNDEQLDSVKKLKTPDENKGFITKIKDSFKFPIQMIKDLKEYEKYKKTTEKEEAKLDKALMQINVSDEQMKEAVSLQKNAFMAFEKLDEKAQRYTDDTEAATNIAKKYIEQIAGIGLGIFIAKNSFDYIEQVQKTKSEFSINKMLKKSWIPMLITGAIEILTEWQANKIKKQAGRIGVMEAIQDLEDPKLFVNN